jgi:hypothetical protein
MAKPIFMGIIVKKGYIVSKIGFTEKELNIHLILPIEDFHQNLILIQELIIQVIYIIKIDSHEKINRTNNDSFN